MTSTMLLIFVRLLTLVVLTISGPYKMIIIFGEPQNYSTFSVKSLDLESCIDYCYELETCMAVYSELDTDDCHVFEIGQLSTVEESDGSVGGKVAIKMTSSDSTQCPLKAEENSMTTGTSINQYNVTASNGIWRFTSITCPKNFTMFDRPLGRWCIGVIPIPTLITQQEAVSKCSSEYDGILSGLQTVEEYNFIIETVQPILNQITDEQKIYNTLGFWINGNRKDSCKNVKKDAKCNGTNEFDFTDLLLSAYDGYIWGIDQPSGTGAYDSNCIHFGFNSTTHESLGVDDYKCDATNTNLSGFIGYVCGVRASVG